MQIAAGVNLVDSLPAEVDRFKGGDCHRVARLDANTFLLLVAESELLTGVDELTFGSKPDHIRVRPNALGITVADHGANQPGQILVAQKRCHRLISE